MNYEWTGPGRLARVGGNNIQPGEEFTPTDSELKSFADRVKEIDTDDAEEEPSEEPEPTQTEEDSSPEDETFTCGVNDCSREVESEDGSCWQHSED